MDLSLKIKLLLHDEQLWGIYGTSLGSLNYQNNKEVLALELR